MLICGVSAALTVNVSAVPSDDIRREVKSGRMQQSGALGISTPVGGMSLGTLQHPARFSFGTCSCLADQMCPSPAGQSTTKAVAMM